VDLNPVSQLREGLALLDEDVTLVVGLLRTLSGTMLVLLSKQTQSNDCPVGFES